MKVLVIIDSLGYGGAERLLVSLLPELLRLGVSCEVALAREPYSLVPELTQHAIPVHYLKVTHRWSLLEAALKVSRLYRTGRFDAVWSHLYFGNLYAAYARVFSWNQRVVWTLHTPDITAPPRRAWDRFRMWLEKATGEHLAHEKVAVSDTSASDYRKVFGWKTSRIYNGVPFSRLPAPMSLGKRREIRQSLGAGEKDFLVIVPARLAPEKGHLVLIEALDILRRDAGWCPICIAVGDGPMKGQLGSILRGRGLDSSMRVMNGVPQGQLFEMIQGSDAVTLPSRYESFGIAAAEAMALGTPTILSDIDAFKELEGGVGAAALFKDGDAVSLAGALARVRDDREFAELLSGAGAKRMRSMFDIQSVAREWAELFAGLARRAPEGR